MTTALFSDRLIQRSIPPQPWIQSASGRKLQPFALDPGSVHVEDIAHALGHLCRFNGHCLGFYSVAEHSVRMSHEVPREDALAALFHDAREYVLGDQTRPVKGSLAVWDESREEFIPFKEVERRAHQVICRALALPSSEIPPSVEAADLRMLMTEARDLMLPPPEAWNIGARPYDWNITPWAAHVAVTRFLLRYRDLTQGEA